jgi:hypothetical protein
VGRVFECVVQRLACMWICVSHTPLTLSHPCTHYQAVDGLDAVLKHVADFALRKSTGGDALDKRDLDTSAIIPAMRTQRARACHRLVALRALQRCVSSSPPPPALLSPGRELPPLHRCL